MDAPIQLAAGRRWIGTAVLLGLAYLAVGVASGALAGAAAANQGLIAWRWVAWVASAVIFAAHIGRERVWFGNSPARTALHTAVAVAIGGFGLAVAATVHSLVVASVDRRLHLFTFALIIWPVVTGVPAYLVAFVTSAVLPGPPRRSY